PPPAAVAVLLAQVELELGAAGQFIAESRETVRHAPDHGARRLGRGLAVRRERLAEAPGRVRLPGQRGQRRQVGEHGDVGQPRLETAWRRDHVPHRGGVVDGAAERQAVLHGGGKHVEQHVAAAVHADQVGVRHPYHVDALGPQALADLGNPRCRRHGDMLASQVVWIQTIRAGAHVAEVSGFFYPRTATGRSSLLPPPPWHYSGDLLTVEYRTDPARVAELLPG